MGKAIDSMSDFEKAMLTPSEREALNEDAEPDEIVARRESGNYSEAEAKDAPKPDAKAKPVEKVDPAPLVEDENQDDDNEDPETPAKAAVKPTAEAKTELSAAELAQLAKEEEEQNKAAADALSDTPTEEELAVIAEAREAQPILIKRQAPALPADFKEQVASLETELSELDAKLDDGEMSTLDYRKESRAIETKILNLRDSEREVIRITKENADGEDALWRWQVAHFSTKIQPQYKNSKLLWGALNQAVIDVSADPKSAGKDGLELLLMAHKAVQKDLGIAIAPPKADATKPKAKTGTQTSKSLAGIPASLADIPSADANETGHERFAALDKLVDDGRWEEYERQLAMMTPADAAAYRQAA